MISRGQFIETMETLHHEKSRQATQLLCVANYYGVPASCLRLRKTSNSYHALLNLLMVVVDDEDHLIEKWLTRNYVADDTGAFVVVLTLDCGKTIPFFVRTDNDLYEYFKVKNTKTFFATCGSTRKNRFCANMGVICEQEELT